MSEYKPTLGTARRRSRAPHHLLLPRWGLHSEGEAVGAGREKEVAAVGGLEETALLRAEVKGLLQPRGFAGALRAEEDDRWVGRHHGALVGPEQVARVLGREDEGAVVLADPAGEADHESADCRILEEEAELVDGEHAPAVFALDARP